MSKKIPKSKLREKENVLYTVMVGTAGFIGSESGTLFLTNQRVFCEKYISGDIRYEINLSDIGECKLGSFFYVVNIMFPLWFFPFKSVVISHKNGNLFRELQCSGWLGSNGKKLLVEMKNALENYAPIVEEKVEETNESDENPEDKLIKLNEIKEKGLISEEDYNNKKEEILKGM